MDTYRMGCQSIQDLFSEYIDGTLQPRETVVVETHLSHCDHCQKDIQALRQAVDALRVLPPLTPPAYFVHAVQARITQKPAPSRLSLPRWLFPSSGGFAVRLVAACILLGSLFPPVRQPVVHGAWGLVYRMGLTATPPPAAIQQAPDVPMPALLPPPVPVGDTAPTVDPAKPDAAPTAPVTTAGSGPIIQTTAGIPAPISLHRPAPPDVSLQFKVDGELRTGGVISVSVVATSGSDLFGSAINASLSPGAQFLINGSAVADNRCQLWSGNLPSGVPTSARVLLRASRPGLYDFRAVVNNGRSDMASSDLLLPVGLDPSAIDIDTGNSGPTDLYTALTTLASRSAHPVAVEDGLTGTRSLSLHVGPFSTGLDAIAAEFGCSSYEKGGVGYVSLRPDVGHAASRGG